MDRLINWLMPRLSMLWRPLDTLAPVSASWPTTVSNNNWLINWLIDFLINNVGIVLAAERRNTNKLLDEVFHSEKIYKLNEDMACSVAGLTSDANLLTNELRSGPVFFCLFVSLFLSYFLLFFLSCSALL